MELTILTAWAEAVSEAVAHTPDQLDAVMSEAFAGAPWRAGLGLAAPSLRLNEALHSLDRLVAATAAAPIPGRFDAMLQAAKQDLADESAMDGLARRALLAMLEERRTRQPPAQ